MRHLLPTDEYSPGASLPPHLSPFVEEQEGDYVPPERQAQVAEQQAPEEEGVTDMETGIVLCNYISPPPNLALVYVFQIM
jgi:hypothetical protein